MLFSFFVITSLLSSNLSRSAIVAITHLVYRHSTSLGHFSCRNCHIIAHSKTSPRTSL